MRKPKIQGTKYVALAMERDAEGNLFVSQEIPLKVGEHDPNLTYRTQDPDGKVTIRPRVEHVIEDGVSMTIPATHPNGNRRLRRARQRHRPEFTKHRKRKPHG